MTKKQALILLSTLLLTSCSFFGSTTSYSGTNNNHTLSINGGTLRKEGLNDVDEINRSLTFSDIFDLENKVEISLDIDRDNLEKLNNDYLTGFKSEIYHHAKSVEIKITKDNKTYRSVFHDVGIRQKGNTSRNEIYDENGNLNYNHYKISFNELFDDVKMYGSEAYDYSNDATYFDYIDNRELLGMSGIDIKWNKNYDATHIKEIQASKIYEDNGILAQHIGLTTFKISNITNNVSLDMGVCSLFEQGNKSLIKRSLKSDKSYLNFASWKEESAGMYGVPGVKYGDLYKVSYGVGEGSYGNGGDLSYSSGDGARIGCGNISGSYIPVYERKTNTDASYNDSLLRDLLKANGIDDYASKMDLDYFSLVEACNYFIGNPDDLRNNNNNYMIYFRRTDGKAVIIPIDNDRCFGITKDYNPDGHGMMEMGPLSQRRANGGEVNKLFKTFLNSNEYKAKYLENLEKISKSEIIKNESFEALYNKAKTTYSDNSSYDGNSKIQYFFSLDRIQGNYTYSEYMNAKLNLLNNELKGMEEIKNGNYGDVYLNGSFSDWKGGKNYKFTYKGEGNYELTFTPNKVENNQIKCKLYDGEDYSRIDWVIVDGTTLNFDGKNSSSFVISSVSTSSSITIKVNTISKVCSIEIK